MHPPRKLAESRIYGKLDLNSFSLNVRTPAVVQT